MSAFARMGIIGGSAILTLVLVATAVVAATFIAHFAGNHAVVLQIFSAVMLVISGLIQLRRRSKRIAKRSSSTSVEGQ